MEKIWNAWKDRIIAIFLMIVSVYFAWHARQFPLNGDIFPIFSLSWVFLLSLFLLLSAVISKKPAEKVSSATFGESNKKPYVLLLLLVIQIVVMPIIGYFVSTGLFITIASIYLGIRRARTIILTLVVLIPSLYFFFVSVLQANLPRGILF